MILIFFYLIKLLMNFNYKGKKNKGKINLQTSQKLVACSFNYKKWR